MQLDELCFGADLGVLVGAKLWLGDGVGLLPLAGAISLGWNLAEMGPKWVANMHGALVIRVVALPS